MGDVTIHFLINSTIFCPSRNDEKEKDLEASAAHANNTPGCESTAFRFESLSHVLPADSTVADVMEFILKQIATDAYDSVRNRDIQQPLAKPTSTLFEQQLHKVSIFDISYHPPKPITSIVRSHNEKSGPMSKTCHSMGWYPSGKLAILPSTSLTDSQSEIDLLEKFVEWQSRNVVHHEEFAYNNPNATSNPTVSSSEKVQWTGVGASTNHGTQQTLKPSEIFNAVEQRFDNDEHHKNHQNQLHSQPSPKTRTKRSENERCQRLDQLLQNLEQSSKSKKKNKAVSQQVRTMLLKSRSEGNKKLRMEDRFHLEVVRLVDDGGGGDSDKAKNNGKDIENTTSYRFFSRVSTAGKVASTAAPSLGDDRAAEFLVEYPSASGGVEGKGADDVLVNKMYRRLPNTMSLHDAERAGWVKEFDVVVIRIYSLVKYDEVSDGYGPSKSVLDPESDDDIDENDSLANDDIIQTVCENDIGTVTTGDKISGQETHAMTIDNGSEFCTEKSLQLQQRIHAIFQSSNDDEDNPKKKKKKKPVSNQVRQMLMKSKSKGNSQVKPDDRIYFEVYTFLDDQDANDSSNGENSPTISYRYFSKKSDVQQIIAACTSTASVQNGEMELIVHCPYLSTEEKGKTNEFKENMEYKYRSLPHSMTIAEAIRRGCLESFGKFIVRIYFAEKGGISCASLDKMS